jgi:hypothetical protein
MLLYVILEQYLSVETDLSGSNSVMVNYPVISGEKGI